MALIPSSNSGSFGFQPQAGAEPYPGYRLIRLRGSGGFATVWEATTPDGELIALKFMSSQNTSTTARELRSLQAIQAVSHPYLIRTRCVWSLPGCIAIGMDLAEASLLDLLHLYLEDLQRPIEVEKLCLYMLHVADALDFLNARQHRIDGRLVGLQHGDIKPNNILLLGDKPLLADYGLATPTMGPITPCPRHGTAEYCAPEVFTGNLTESSDQFSFAVSYYVLRTGSFPFPPPPDRSRLKDYRRPDPDLTALSEIERIPLMRALSHVPQQRYSSCTEFMMAVLTSLRLNAHRTDDGELFLDTAPNDSSSSSSGKTKSSHGSKWVM